MRRQSARPLAIAAAGSLLTYIEETQKSALPHLTGLTVEHADETIVLDAARTTASASAPSAWPAGREVEAMKKNPCAKASKRRFLQGVGCVACGPGSARTLAESSVFGNGRIAPRVNERVKARIALTTNRPPPISRPDIVTLSRLAEAQIAPHFPSVKQSPGKPEFQRMTMR